MISLRTWVSELVASKSHLGIDESDVVMIAHYGSCHDHVILLKTMMSWGLNPPQWRFSDSLPIFKLVVQPDDNAKLSDLVSRYVPWINHVEHDAFSDAEALKAVVMIGVTRWNVACFAFSVPCDDFIMFVGLNAFGVRNPLPFPGMSLDSI
jgi:hypothetical protein